jgi:hypothetical protein
MFINYEILPEHMRGAAKRWIEDGISPGSFLLSVICNDFFNAVTRADSINYLHLKDIALFFHWETPPDCWGSPKKANRWNKMGGLNGIAKKGKSCIK